MKPPDNHGQWLGRDNQTWHQRGFEPARQGRQPTGKERLGRGGKALRGR